MKVCPRLPLPIIIHIMRRTTKPTAHIVAPHKPPHEEATPQ